MRILVMKIKKYKFLMVAFVFLLHCSDKKKIHQIINLNFKLEKNFFWFYYY